MRWNEVTILTLLITIFAAIASTIVWYTRQPGNKLKLNALCSMYWGASLMWLIDAIFEYAERGADYFTPAVADMVNDAFLGLSVVAFGLVIWLAILLVSDPNGKVRAALKK